VDSWGHVLKVSIRQFSTVSPAVRHRVEGQIITCLAGREAEWLISGRYNHRGAASDYHAASDFVFRLVGSDEEAQAYFRWLAIRARQLIRAHHSRPQIDALAAALLEHHEL